MQLRVIHALLPPRSLTIYLTHTAIAVIYHTVKISFCIKTSIRNWHILFLLLTLPLMQSFFILCLYACYLLLQHTLTNHHLILSGFLLNEIEILLLLLSNSSNNITLTPTCFTSLFIVVFHFILFLFFGLLWRQIDTLIVGVENRSTRFRILIVLLLVNAEVLYF